MSLERIGDPRKVKHWMGHMEADYQYTHGLAGEKFFKEIKENAKITGTKCHTCDLTYVPPRLFCERCFEKLEDWVEVSKTGRVHTYTVAHIDTDGSKLKEPLIWALIKIEGIHGGFVHRLGDIDPKDVKIGMAVEAVLKARKDRTGSMSDIKHFRPVAQT
jgi:uncharacterized OB-fold protein